MLLQKEHTGSRLICFWGQSNLMDDWWLKGFSFSAAHFEIQIVLCRESPISVFWDVCLSSIMSKWGLGANRRRGTCCGHLRIKIAFQSELSSKTKPLNLKYELPSEATARFVMVAYIGDKQWFGFDLGGKFGFLFNSFLGMAVWGDLWQLRSDFGRLTGSYPRLV